MLYEKLRKEHKFYCLGKRPSALKAICRYIEGVIGDAPYMSQQQIGIIYDVSEATLGKNKEIVKLLKLEERGQWGWLKQNNSCTICGLNYMSKNRSAKYCNICKVNIGLIHSWENANMCLCCGELNPLFLLSKNGHHIFGINNDEFSIPICANCHELTKPLSRQGFFLFNNRPFPLENKFSEDNSKIYIHIE